MINNTDKKDALSKSYSNHQKALLDNSEKREEYQKQILMLESWISKEVKRQIRLYHATELTLAVISEQEKNYEVLARLIDASDIVVDMEQLTDDDRSELLGKKDSDLDLPDLYLKRKIELDNSYKELESIMIDVVSSKEEGYMMSQELNDLERTMKEIDEQNLELKRKIKSYQKIEDELEELVKRPSDTTSTNPSRNTYSKKSDLLKFSRDTLGYSLIERVDSLWYE